MRSIDSVVAAAMCRRYEHVIQFHKGACLRWFCRKHVQGRPGEMSDLESFVKNVLVY